jgi:hypothetical protein
VWEPRSLPSWDDLATFTLLVRGIGGIQFKRAGQKAERTPSFFAIAKGHAASSAILSGSSSNQF